MQIRFTKRHTLKPTPTTAHGYEVGMVADLDQEVADKLIAAGRAEAVAEPEQRRAPRAEQRRAPPTSKAE